MGRGLTPPKISWDISEAWVGFQGSELIRLALKKKIPVATVGKYCQEQK